MKSQDEARVRKTYQYGKWRESVHDQRDYLPNEIFLDKFSMTDAFHSTQ